MGKRETGVKTPSRRKSGPLPVIAVIAVLVGVPLAIFAFQAYRTGLSLQQMLEHVFRGARTSETAPGVVPGVRGEKADFLPPAPIGFAVDESPRIGSITVADLDRDGLRDIIVCDMLADRVGWIRQHPPGTYVEKWVSPPLRAPARAQPCDVDRDGDFDLLVAVMGQLFPNNDKIGSVVILENDGRQNFTPHVVIERVARVTDVRGGDFDADGDVDLVVGQFGYDDGETRWMENLGNWQFRSHMLQSLSGVIHTIPVDIDRDGDLDIVSLVTQEWEEIYLFENDGRGNFKSHLVWGSTNEDYGCSAMRVADLNGDGNMDILFTNGDAFDYLPPRPRPWHSVQWLENRGDLEFEYHPIGKFNGASDACAADVDGDGDLDVVVVSAYNLWERLESQSMMWFENDGKMNFIQHDVAHTPTHIIALDSGDMNNDGKIDFVSGRMNVYPPFTREHRVTLWLNHWGAARGGRLR